jgi:hypothetical protein
LGSEAVMYLPLITIKAYISPGRMTICSTA